MRSNKSGRATASAPDAHTVWRARRGVGGRRSEPTSDDGEPTIVPRRQIRRRFRDRLISRHAIALWPHLTSLRSSTSIGITRAPHCSATAIPRVARRPALPTHGRAGPWARMITEADSAHSDQPVRRSHHRRQRWPRSAPPQSPNDGRRHAVRRDDPTTCGGSEPDAPRSRSSSPTVNASAPHTSTCAADQLRLPGQGTPGFPILALQPT
jgi:hypothetical protein